MRLIGMLDSPYVRRVGISLTAAGLPFVSERISVFRNFDAFAAINPVVKAPTLLTDDGVMLMDSSLILEYIERLTPPQRRLMPDDLAGFVRAQRIIGLAMAACEKTVQIVYERNQRPAEKQHQPWIDRVQGQLLSAYELLEAEIVAATGDGTTWIQGARLLQADITSAVAWRFTNGILPGLIDVAVHPALSNLSGRAETSPEFKAVPVD